MDTVYRKPRILVVTPEMADFPTGMWGGSASLSANAGGLADVSAALIEALFEQGIDVAEFWQDIYFEHPPGAFGDTRRSNTVDLLTSGVFAAHFVNTVSPSFLHEAAQANHAFTPVALQQELANKMRADCAVGILNAPHPSYNPRSDPCLHRRYCSDNPGPAKAENKTHLQKRLGLAVYPQAPFFSGLRGSTPSRRAVNCWPICSMK